MRNIEKTFRFFIKNWVIVIPTVIGCVIVNVIGGVFSLLNFFSSLDLLKFTQLDQFIQNQQFIQSMNYLIPIYAMALAVSIVSIIISFLYYPIMAGLVHESIRNSKTINIHDLFIASKEAFFNNIKKYANFFAANFLFGIIFYVILLIILFTIMFVTVGTIATAKGSVIALFLLLLFVLIIVILALSIVYGAFTSMWFQSIIVDNYKVFDAFKVCFGILKRRFWYLMGMFLLVSLISVIVSVFALGFGIIPLFGWVVTGCIAGIIAMFQFVFYMYMYYENRPNLELINNQQIENNEGIQY